MFKKALSLILVLATVANLLLLSSCAGDVSIDNPGNRQNIELVDPFNEDTPWDNAKEIPASELFELVKPGTKLFSGLEWTG